MKKEKERLEEPSKAQKYALKAQERAQEATKQGAAVGGREDFSASMSYALKQKNEKWFLLGIVSVVAVIVLLLIGALADILTLCFEVNRIFGYTMVAITVIFLALFVIRPVCKVLGARFFVTDVTNADLNVAKRKNRRALKEVSFALVKYNTDPKNARFKYLSDENIRTLQEAAERGKGEELKAALRNAYSTDVGACANSLIFKSAGKVFLQTSVSQNDKIDALSVLLTNLSLVKQIVGIYGYRPSYAKLFRIYASVLRNALIAYGMENVNWFNVFGKFFSGVAKKVPFVDTLVDSAVQGTVSAFLTLLVGYKTKRYLCSDYKKQERLEEQADAGVDTGDDEVKIASALAKEVRKKNREKAEALAE